MSATELAVHPDPAVHDLPGRFAITGLVDAHLHLTMDFSAAAPPPGAARVAHNVAVLQRAGVLAARDAGRPIWAPEPSGERAARYAGADLMLAPAAGFHPAMHEPVGRMEVVAAAVAQARAGRRWIKLIADFPGADGNWFAPRVAYPPKLVAEVVGAVHAEGARVMTHVSGPIVADLVRAGVDSIEHGPLVDRPALEEMAAGGTIWVPTVATIAAHVGILAQWRETLPLAAELGVRVLAGSDELPAGGLHREVEALVACGLPPAVALAAATTTARSALDLPAGSGDVVTFDTDPRLDPTALREPVAVLAGGLRVR
jgi:imidazolonepropionase-like amidohydrolase